MSRSVDGRPNLCLVALVDDADKKLFGSISHNHTHVLHHYLIDKLNSTTPFVLEHITFSMLGRAIRNQSAGRGLDGNGIELHKYFRIRIKLSIIGGTCLGWPKSLRLCWQLQ